MKPIDPNPTVADALGELSRSANASIRGYFTQIIYSAIEWLTLTDQEILVVEGREDLDRYLIAADGQIGRVEEVQLKDLANAVNIRDTEVWQSVFNFASAYHLHHTAGRDCRFTFATTTNFKEQLISDSTQVRSTPKTTRLDLEIDVLTAWDTLPGIAASIRPSVVDRLARAIRALFDMNIRGHLPDANEDFSKLNPEARRALLALNAIEWLDESSAWDSFCASVRWVTGLPSAEELTARLDTKVSEHVDLKALPATEFAQTLIYHVLRAASQSEPTQRFLTKRTLHELADKSEQSLRDWAKQIGLPRLKDWLNFQTVLLEHERRIAELETTVSHSLPTTMKAIERLRYHSRVRMARVRNTIASVQVNRSNRLTELNRALDDGPVVLLGRSGAGKSAIVRTYCEIVEEDSGAAIWFGAPSFQRPDLAALYADLQLHIPLEEVVADFPEMVVLVLDGLDQIYDTQSLLLVADLIRALSIDTEHCPCDTIITCQTEQWPRLEEFFKTVGLLVAWRTLEFLPLTLTELDPIFREIPAAKQLAQEPRLKGLLENLKIVDLIASRYAVGAEIDPARFIGETSVAKWFWETEVATGDARRARDRLTLHLAERQADTLQLPVSLTDFGVGDIASLDGLETDRICVVDERNQVYFAHDLFGDWGRLRLLLSKDRPVEYLSGRLQSPLWHRAVRLLGAHYLDDSSDVQSWKALFERLRTTGGEAISDLLLESLIFAANSTQHLALVSSELLADKGLLLCRLIGRFLAFATLPDPRFRDIGRSLGLKSSLVSSRCRQPNWVYWPPLLGFLYKHRDCVVPIALNQIARVVKLWLDFTPPGYQLRNEAAEIALLIGRLAHSERHCVQNGRAGLFATALLGIRECEQEVVSFALEAAERTTVQKPDDPTSSVALRSHPKFDPDEMMPDAAADGPRNRVDPDFRKAVLDGNALAPLIALRPEIAREVLLGCLLASRHRGRASEWHRDEWRLDLAYSAWNPASPFRGSFLQLLRVNFDQGLEAVARLIDFAAVRWQQRRKAEAPEARNHRYEHDCPTFLVVQMDKTSKTMIGNDSVLGWSAGLGGPLPDSALTSALMALEQYFYLEVEGGREVEKQLRRVMDRVTSVPFLHVLLDVGRLVPKLFEGPLLFLLGIPELYSWEIAVRVQGRHHLLMVAGLDNDINLNAVRRFNRQEHRQIDLRELAMRLFLTSKTVREFLEGRRIQWAVSLDSLPAGRRRDMLQSLVLLFDAENYRVVGHDDHVIIRNTAIEKLDAALQPERDAHFEAMAMAMLPIKCRMLIDQNQQLSLGEIESFWLHLRSLSQVCETKSGREAATNPARSEVELETTAISSIVEPANALAGGVAVLICQHLDWLKDLPERLEWCRDVIVGIVDSPPEPGRFDCAESNSELIWDSFAADALVLLWSQNPQDPHLRRSIAELVGAPHYVAVARLFHRCSCTGLPARDIQGLRRLAFEFAFVLNRINFLRNYPGFSSFDGDEILAVSEGVQAWTDGLDAWAEGRVLAFVENRLEPPTTPWIEMDSYAFSGTLDELRSRWLRGYVLDFVLVKAAHRPLLSPSSRFAQEEESYRFTFLKDALSFWRSCKESRADEEYTYPDGDAGWLLGEMGRAICSLSADDAMNLWGCLMNFPPEDHQWPERFLNSFYGAHLAEDPAPALFGELAFRFVETSIARPPGLRWAVHYEVWPALFGIDHFNRGLWGAQHSELALSLWPLMQAWLSRQSIPNNHLAAVARWLSFDAASALRVMALISLQEALNNEDRSRHEQEQLENSVGELLHHVWGEHNAELRLVDEAFAAFKQLLSWLGDLQNSIGLELLGRIGGF